MFLNEKIRKARLEKKMTQQQLANELSNLGRKTSNTAIANWESGLNSPDVDTLQLICKILDKDGNYFFDIQNNNVNTVHYDKINTQGLNDDEIEELNKFADYMRNKKAKGDK